MLMYESRGYSGYIMSISLYVCENKVSYLTPCHKQADDCFPRCVILHASGKAADLPVESYT